MEWLKDPTRQVEELLHALNNSLPLLECLLVGFYAQSVAQGSKRYLSTVGNAGIV